MFASAPVWLPKGGYIPWQRLLEAAAREDKIDELAAAVEQAVARQPQWSGGKPSWPGSGSSQGRADLGRRMLDDLLNSLSRSLELFDYQALVVIGQELKDNPAGTPLALAVYERMLRERGTPGATPARASRAVPSITWPGSMSTPAGSRTRTTCFFVPRPFIAI